jgi:hypothetical protein
MTKSQEIFDNIFAERGGIFNPELFKGDIATKDLDFYNGLKSSILKIVKEKIKPSYPNLPEIHFEFIFNNSLNAAATKYEGEYYVGINIGAFFLIYDMFNKMFSTKSILSGIGNNENENDDKKILSCYMSSEGITFDENDFARSISLPKDLIRREYARQYTAWAMHFLVFHECAHIIRGHVDFVATKKNKNFWNEFDYSSSPNLYDSSFFQTLEMDADSFATNRSFILANLMINDYDNLSIVEKQICHNWATFSSNWIFVIYSLFRLFGFNLNDLESAKNKTHPPSTIRLSLIHGNIATLFMKVYGENYLKSVSKSTLDSIVQAEKTFNLITYQENMLDKYFNTFLDQSLSLYVKEITDNWNNVRLHLEPFAYGSLPGAKVD